MMLITPPHSIGRSIRLATARPRAPLPARARGESEGVHGEAWRRGESGWVGARCTEEGTVGSAWAMRDAF